MLKPAALRAHLEATTAWLRSNPEKLLVNIEAGHLRLTGAATRSFEYRYTLALTLLDYPEHPTSLFVPLIQWLETHQPELILNPALQEQGLRFEVDILNNTTLDLAIRLQLTERVLVTLNPDGTHTAQHIPEPTAPLASYTWQTHFTHPEASPAWPNP